MTCRTGRNNLGNNNRKHRVPYGKCIPSYLYKGSSPLWLSQKSVPLSSISSTAAVPWFIVFLIVLQRNKIVSDNPSRETYFILKRSVQFWAFLGNLRFWFCSARYWIYRSFDRLPYLHYIYRGPWADFPAQHLYFSKRHFKRTSSTLPFSASANDPFKLLKRSGNWRLPFLFWTSSSSLALGPGASLNRKSSTTTDKLLA